MQIERGDGVAERLICLLATKFKNNRLIIITGQDNSYEIAEEFASKISNDYQLLRAIDSPSFIDKLKRDILDDDVVISIGGGKVIDISKEVAFHSKAVLIALPTVLSNDGLANGLVVIKSVNDSKSIYRKAVDYLFVDFDIISNSPDIYIKSAIGDVFSNYSALNDWMLDGDDEYVKETVELSLQKIKDVDFSNIDNTLDAIIYSGKSVEYLKNSSAISGSEHLILHSLERLFPDKMVNHGIAVASISLFTMFLQQKLEAHHVEFIFAMQIPASFLSLYPLVETQYEELFRLAKSYRQHRKTVLNSYSDFELRRQLNLFINNVDSFDKKINLYNQII